MGIPSGVKEEMAAGGKLGAAAGEVTEVKLLATSYLDEELWIRKFLLSLLGIMLLWHMGMATMLRLVHNDGTATEYVALTCNFFFAATMAMQRTLVPAARLAPRRAWTLDVLTWFFLVGHYLFRAAVSVRPPGSLEWAVAGIAIVGNLAFTAHKILRAVPVVSGILDKDVV